MAFMRSLLAAASLSMAVPVMAQSLGGKPDFSPEQEWICTCVLCLGNPKGPDAEPACRSSMDKLRTYIRRGWPIPQCKSAESAGTTMRQEFDYYDQCPAGTEELKPGQYAVLAVNGAPPVPITANMIYMGGSTERDTVTNSTSSQGKPRICVGSVVKPGPIEYIADDGSRGLLPGSNVYGTLQVLRPYVSPMVMVVNVRDASGKVVWGVRVRMDGNERAAVAPPLMFGGVPQQPAASPAGTLSIMRAP